MKIKGTCHQIRILLFQIRFNSTINIQATVIRKAGQFKKAIGGKNLMARKKRQPTIWFHQIPVLFYFQRKTQCQISV